MSSSEGSIEGHLLSPSRSGINTPRHTAPAGSALDELVRDFRPGHEPVIAVDMDDVLSQTNDVVAKCEFSFSDPDEIAEKPCRAQRGVWNKYDTG